MAEGLRITSGLVIPEDELHMEAARGGGPGGQNVNKVASKVILRFAPRASRALSEAQMVAVEERLAHRLTTAGELVLHASRFRSQARNLEDARERLSELLAAALRQRKARKATRPTRSSQRRRVDSKRKRGAVKRDRGRSGEAE